MSPVLFQRYSASLVRNDLNSSNELKFSTIQRVFVLREMKLALNSIAQWR